VSAEAPPKGIIPPSEPGGRSGFLSDVIVELGFATASEVEEAVREARAGSTVAQVLVESGAITEEELARVIAERYGLAYIDLNDFEVDRDAAFAAIQAAAEAAASAEVATDAAERAEAVADIAIELVGAHDEDGGSSSTDFDAAEAEAAASADATGDSDDIPVIGDEALAARLADLLPGGSENGAAETQTTQVVVTGLVSVASIASFKRHLGRLTGVKSVGVSSGPEGEFLFAVHHTADIVLRDAIPSLPSFQARVTGSGEGTLSVTAHDPESDH
jgi:hypothetical protein